MWDKLPAAGALASLSLEDVVSLMEMASKTKNTAAVQRLCETKNKRLNDLPSLIGNIHKEKQMISGSSADKIDTNCQRAITDDGLRDIYKEVDALCEKIKTSLPPENAYFVRLSFQEMHMCLFIRALSGKNIVHSTIGPGGGKTFVQH